MECIPSISPVDPQKSWISSVYGTRVSPFTGKKQFHTGIDIAGWQGTPIMAPAKGKVTSVRKWGSMGLMVKINHDSTYQTVYGHLLKAAVKRGQRIKRGEVIGYMGNSGRSTGYHLHYEVRKNGKRINPFFHMMDWDKNSTLMASSEE
jgi:murein DD-endopeptidase MepM/ murein hydrolase activator NlpD